LQIKINEAFFIFNISQQKKRRTNL
jgi:hypothetical protein